MCLAWTLCHNAVDLTVDWNIGKQTIEESCGKCVQSKYLLNVLYLTISQVTGLQKETLDPKGKTKGYKANWTKFNKIS